MRLALASHLKLDEIIKSIDEAQNEMIDIEHLSDDGLQKLADKYQRVREECDTRVRLGPTRSLDSCRSRHLLTCEIILGAAVWQVNVLRGQLSKPRGPLGMFLLGNRVALWAR